MKPAVEQETVRKDDYLNASSRLIHYIEGVLEEGASFDRKDIYHILLEEIRLEKEPSDGNALNLQLALGKLCDKWDAESEKWTWHPLIQNTYGTCAFQLRECLSSQALESDSGSSSTDSHLIDWMEDVGAQVWRDSRKGTWTLFLRVPTREPVQPTRDTLREVIEAGIKIRNQRISKSSPSSPLLETNREEDSAPEAQPGATRTNDTTGQATQL